MPVPAFAPRFGSKPAGGARDFDGFCRTALGPQLAELERRRRVVLVFIVLAGGCALASAAFFALAPSGSLHGIHRLLPLTLLGTVVLGVVGWWKQSGYRRDFKQEIMPEIVRFVSPGVVYSADDGVRQSTFVAGAIFPRGIDRYSAEDRVAGQIGKTPFEFSEVHAEYKTESSNDEGKRSTEWHTIFRGLYFVADFNKDFRTHTVVLPDRLERFGFLNRTLQKMNTSRGQLVSLEDPEFERAFVVYGDDQVEARYILTPALMQRMLALRSKVKGPVFFAFSGSAVHVAIRSRQDHFEPTIWRSIRNPQRLAECCADLRLLIGMVEDLDLNTRIWTKV